MANSGPKQKRVDIKKALGLYRKGHTIVEVAAIMGETRGLIHDRLKSAGYIARPRIKRDQSGSHNASWKGPKALYEALHVRVSAARGKPRKCAMCESGQERRYEWANMTGDYTNIYDYVRLCVGCHHRLDSTITNIKKMRANGFHS
jgi:hypothetical protein